MSQQSIYTISEYKASSLICLIIYCYGMQNCLLEDLNIYASIMYDIGCLKKTKPPGNEVFYDFSIYTCFDKHMEYKKEQILNCAGIYTFQFSGR